MPQWTTQEVLDHIRRHGRRKETLNVLYVTDESGHLMDDLDIATVLLAPLEQKIDELMGMQSRSVKATDDQEVAVTAFRNFGLNALPVTDSQGVLLGIVTSDDILEVAEEEATEDIHKLGGLEALDEPYLHISIRRMVKKRAGWLIILFIGEMFTATAMGFFQNEIARATVLALFVPLIISSGGNSGSQAATLVIRALALGEVSLIDWWNIMRREIISGLFLGGILGFIGFVRISVWSGFSIIRGRESMYGPHWVLIALTIWLSLIGVVLWGTIAGSMLPLVLKKCKLDPATSSAPFVATLVDVSGLMIYFTVASLLLSGKIL
jgi:magnesium transporter